MNPFRWIRNWWSDLSGDTRVFLVVITTLWCIAWGIAGSVLGVNNKCEYRSVFSRINIPYVIACELSEPRFKP